MMIRRSARQEKAPSHLRRKLNRKSEVLKDSGIGHDQRKTMKDEYKRFATPRRPSIPMYQNTFLGICYSCNIFGHKPIDCRYYDKVVHMRNENPFSPLSKYHQECSKCNNYGHTTNNCQISFDKSNKGLAKECGLALYAENAKNQWYIDCGFSKHMTGGQNKFIMLKNEKGESVTFGNDGAGK